MKESEPAFSGFGVPVPLVESSEGGDDMLNGIGINTGAYNYRAVGCKWMAGERSYLNDVKFVGGHGTLRKPAPNASGQSSYRRDERRISSPSSPVMETGRIWLGTTSIGVCGLQTMAAGQLRMFGQPVRMLPVGFILAKRRLGTYLCHVFGASCPY